MSFHVSNYGSFAYIFQNANVVDNSGYVPEKGDFSKNFNFHDTQSQDLKWREIIEAATTAKAEADKQLTEWQSRKSR